MAWRGEEDKSGLLRIYQDDKLFGKPLTWEEAIDLRKLLRKPGRGRPKDSDTALANLLGDWILGRARQEKGRQHALDAEMSRRTFERKRAKARDRGIYDVKSRKLTPKGLAARAGLVIVLDHPHDAKPSGTPSDILAVGLVERSLLAKFDAQGRPLNGAARRSARTMVKTKMVRSARCRIRDAGEMCAACGRLVTAWAICPVTGEPATGKAPAKSRRRTPRR